MTQRLLLCVAAFALVAVVCAAPMDASERSFLQWMKQHNRRYNSQDEYAQRLAAFRATLSRLSARNAAAKSSGSSVVFGLNSLSDWTEAEFKKYLTFRAPTAVTDLPDFPLCDGQRCAEPTHFVLCDRPHCFFFFCVVFCWVEQWTVRCALNCRAIRRLSIGALTTLSLL